MNKASIPFFLSALAILFLIGAYLLAGPEELSSSIFPGVHVTIHALDWTLMSGIILAFLLVAIGTGLMLVSSKLSKGQSAPTDTK